MAEHAAPSYSTATGNDYGEHERTYDFFINLTKYGTIVVIIILVLMAFFLL